MALKFPVGISIEAIDNATAKTRAIANGISRATAPLSKISTSFKGLSEAAQFPKLMEGFRGVGSALGDLGAAAKRAAFLVGGIAVAAGGAAFAIVKSFAEAGDSAFKGAQKIGIGVEALQELRYAAKLANLETEEFDAALIKLTRNAALAARGQKSAAKPFERLGISVLGANGQLRDAGDLLGEIADKFGRLDDPLKRAALAQEIFGKAGANLIPLLASGSRGLAEMGAEARKLGIVMSRESAAKGEEFMDMLTRVGESLRGVRNAIGAELLPVLLDLAKKFQVWVTDHIPTVRRFAERLARDLPAALRKAAAAFESFWEKTEPVRVVLAKLYDLLGPVGTALAVVAGVLVVTLAPAIISTIAALASLSVALVATPAGWVVLALTAIAAALAAVVAGIALVVLNWDGLSERFPRLAAVMEKFASSALGHMLNQLTTVALAVEALIGHFERLLGIVPDWAFDLLGINLANKGSGPKGMGKFGTAGAPKTANAGPAIAAPAQAEFMAMVRELVQGAEKLKATDPRSIALQDAILGPNRIPRSEASVHVDFSNLPRGARVSSETKGETDLDLSMGYALTTP